VDFRLIVSRARALVAVVAVALPAAAQASPNLRMTWQAGDNSAIDFNWNDVNGEPGGVGSLNGFGEWDLPGADDTWAGYDYTGALIGQGHSGNADDFPGQWMLNWDCVFSGADTGLVGINSVYVTANIVVTNTDLVNPQKFSLLISMPAFPIADPWERGSIVGTVTDLTGDDAFVSAPMGSQIYTPRIDSVDEMPGFLMSDPFTAGAGGPFLSGPVGPQDFGTPNWVQASQPVDDDIAIFLNFDVSPGDSASFTAIFEVAVPSPGALPLLGLALLRGRRRRRSA
jgi:MYXO-CTERM domain-containing protein